MRPVCRIHPAGGCTCCSPPAVKGAQVIMKESKTSLFQQAMPEGMEAALFEDPSNRYYFTEMRSSAGAVLITRKSAVFWIDFRYFEQALEVVTDAEVREEKDRSAQVRQFLEESGIHTLSVCAGQTTLKRLREMEEALPGIDIDSSDTLQQLIDGLRSIKREDELADHRKAQQITDHTFDHILDYIRPGLSELEIAHEIGYTLTKFGSDERSFNYIVASGPNSSKPHGFATNRVVRKGDLITMDFGAVVNGRFADMTRTVALGRITAEQEQAYETVRKAQSMAMAAIRPGAVCRQIDLIARQYIYSSGYSGCFSHGLGHSVGIDVHENPRFNEVCTDELKPGMLLTVEPGIYIAGRFGVRIEDMVAVTGDGFLNLTGSPHELITL